MSKKDDLVWILDMLAIFIGFILIMISVSEVSHTYFVVGLLLFTVAVYRLGYDRGFHIGRLVLQGQKNVIQHNSSAKEELIAVLEVLAVIIGFILIIISVSEIVYSYFVVGFLLFTVGTHRFGYSRGQGMGKVAQYEEQRKKEKSESG